MWEKERGRAKEGNGEREGERMEKGRRRIGKKEGEVRGKEKEGKGEDIKRWGEGETIEKGGGGEGEIRKKKETAREEDKEIKRERGKRRRVMEKKG